MEMRSSRPSERTSTAKASLSRSSLSRESIEPETSIRKTRLRPRMVSVFSRAVAKPKVRSLVSGFHGQGPRCVVTEKRSPAAGSA